MNALGWAVDGLMWPVQAGALLWGVHLYAPLVAAVAARVWPAPADPAPAQAPGRLAVLIPARNESRVIAGALAAWRRQTYPADAFDVFVIADHCCDDTAEQARAAGAVVLERGDDGPRTKGGALAWAWERVAPHQYTGVIVADADNHPAPEFLAAMAAELSRGHRAIQGLRRPQSVHSSHARLDALTELCTHRIAAAGRRWLGLGAPLMGSGMAFEAATFGRLLAHTPDVLVEDCAWQAQLAEWGVAAHWTPHAVVFDEKTAQAGSMQVQRQRWVAGRGAVARRFTGPLLRQACRSRSLLAFDNALYLSAPPRSLLLGLWGGLAVLALSGALGSVWPAWLWLGLLGLFGVYVAAALWLDGASWRDAWHLVGSVKAFPGFAWMMARALVRTLRGAPVHWVPTPHGHERTPSP